MAPIMMEVIEWFDQSGTGIVHRYPEEGSGDIKMGAQLIVRENQAALFVNEGKAADLFTSIRINGDMKKAATIIYAVG